MPHRSSIGRAPLVLAAALVLAFAGGLAAFGWRTDATAQRPAVRAAAGCVEEPLRFGVSDDPAEVARQSVFERSGAPVPAARVHDRVLPRTPLLHAVSHGHVVVLERPGAVDREATAAIRDLVALAAAKNVSVLAAPARQRPALVALRSGRRLTCTAGGAAQVRAVRRFAAEQFSILRWASGGGVGPRRAPQRGQRPVVEERGHLLPGPGDLPGHRRRRGR